MAHGRSKHTSRVVNPAERPDRWDPDEIFAHYAQRLSRVADRYLSRRLAGRLDGEDVVQSVFRTFFRRSSRGEFQIDSTAQLWRLLVKITVQKARAKGRHHAAGRRDVKAEVGGDAQGWLAEAAASEPGPSDAAAMMDQIDVMLRGLPPIYCGILDLRLQGCKAMEIARRLEISRQTVYRALTLLHQRLEGSDASC
jgi:RNA polymerase sigma-70 factor, ECF subfamily